MDDVHRRLTREAEGAEFSNRYAALCRDAAAEIERLRNALTAMRGAFDTPIARRRLNSEFADEARQIARGALKQEERD